MTDLRGTTLPVADPAEQVADMPGNIPRWLHDDDTECVNPALCSRLPHRRDPPRPRGHAGMPDGWRDVPMPQQIANLPTTGSGIPVTYTVAWSSENKVELRPDGDLASFMGHAPLAVFSSGRRGEGTPKLAITDTARARRATMRGWCQICGLRLPDRGRRTWDRNPRWCGYFSKGQTIRHRGQDLPLIIDGWTCESCMAYSLKVCPALVDKQGDHEAPLMLLRIRRAELVAVQERPDSIPHDQLTEMPVGMVKIAPTDFDWVHPEAFPDA